MSNATTVFHCNVGGELQDGLFGLAELDVNRFVVVGSTGRSLNTATSLSGLGFPFSTICPTTPIPTQFADFAQGVFIVFNAQNILTTGALAIEVSRPIGAAPSEEVLHTVLRDVVVQRGFNYDVELAAGVQDIAPDLVLVVGSTDDPNVLIGTLGVTAPLPQPVFGGQTDGLLLAMSSSPGNQWVTPTWGSYRGGLGRDGLVGVQSWNEHVDHFSAVGFVDADDPSLPNIDVVGYHLDTSRTEFSLAGPVLQIMRAIQVGGSVDERPAAIGLQAATLPVAPGQAFVDFGLGDPAGGGIAVDSRGRIDVVGVTADPGVGTGYPVEAGRAFVADQDAVRTSIDMLPDGVGRTDGTGAPVPAGGPPLPMPGFFGGATPECALDPFGNRVGATPPPLRSMLIDYEGAAPAQGVSNAVIIVSRLPVSHSAHLIALHFGFPSFIPGNPGPPPIPPTFTPFVFPEGVIMWTTNNPLTSFQLDPPDRTARFPLFPMTPASFTMTVQAFGLLTGPIPGGNQGPVCGNSTGSMIYASPALWLDY